MTPTIRFEIHVHTKNTLNANFGNSRAAALAQAAKDRLHRDASRAATIVALRKANVHPADLIPCVVTLTRCSAGTLDKHDGLRAALKRVVDGIALALGVDDGGPFVDWDYKQAPAPPKVHGVVVVIEKRGDCAKSAKVSTGSRKRQPDRENVNRPAVEAEAELKLKRKRRRAPPDEVA